MNIACQKCRQPIPFGDVNVAKDIALCRRCEKTFSFAELAVNSTGSDLDLTKPPRGAWFQSNPRGFTVGATTRSAEAFFLVPFTAVWSGFSMAGIYGTQIANGQFSWGQSLFGLPFLAGTCYLVPTAMMMCCGKQELRVESGQAVLFTGIGPVGWRRRFDWMSVTGAKTSAKEWGRNGNPTATVILEGANRIRFGSLLNRERRVYVLAVLKRLIEKTHP